MTHRMTVTTLETDEWKAQPGTASEALAKRVERLKADGVAYAVTGNSIAFMRKDRLVTLTYLEDE